MTSTARPDNLQISRAEQRKQRLLELESEQAREEAEAFRLTEDQRMALYNSFASVKVEFSDLDGLRWSQAALRLLQPRQCHNPTYSPQRSNKPNTFVVLSKSDLSTFAPEDTVRGNPTLKTRSPLSSAFGSSSPQLSDTRAPTGHASSSKPHEFPPSSNLDLDPQKPRVRKFQRTPARTRRSVPPGLHQLPGYSQNVDFFNNAIPVDSHSDDSSCMSNSHGPSLNSIYSSARDRLRSVLGKPDNPSPVGPLPATPMPDNNHFEFPPLLPSYSSDNLDDADNDYMIKPVIISQGRFTEADFTDDDGSWDQGPTPMPSPTLSECVPFRMTTFA